MMVLGEQAQIALAIAERQGWPQQVRRVVTDFELASTPVEAGA